VNPFDQIAHSDVPDLAVHGVRTANMATAMARALDIPANVISDIAAAARLHDIGKIQIDPGILSKPGPLDAGEWEELERHCQIGYDMIHKSVDPNVSTMVLGHHERLDGTGYPNGIGPGAIGMPLRILHVADAFDAITSERPYQPAMPIEYAVSELTSNLGTQFDADVVGALIAVVTYGSTEAEQSRIALSVRHRLAAVG
jgi:HD-GYP domain-containing protein (c-di-GMP phosphodiesterase class II)